MPTEQRPLKVFLCHASQDKPKVRELYRSLRRRGMQPWLDAEDLIPGQNWEVEIPKALYLSDAIIICLSPNSVDKEGYVQKEIRFALDKALEMPEGRIFLIPAKLEECELPLKLRQYQAVNLYEKEGYLRLMKALKLRASQLKRATVEFSKETAEFAGGLEKDVNEDAKREAAKDPARDKAQREIAENAKREQAEQEAREKDERERIEREAAEKVAREKANREKLERDVTERAKHGEKVKVNGAEEKPTRKPHRGASKKTEPRGLQSRLGTSPIFWATGIIAIIATLIVIMLQAYLPPPVPTATASVTITLGATQTATLHPDPTLTSTRTSTIVPADMPDYLGGSEILFATRGGSIYSFANNTNSKIGSISVPNEWNSQPNVLGTHTWSWDVSKDSFIVQGLHTDQDVYFVDRSGQVMSSLEVPYTNYCPNLSRDGKKIVVYSQAVTNGNIWVFNADGSGFIRLSLSSSMRFGCPAWSPDGKMITAGASDSEGSYVVIMDLTGDIIKQFSMTRFFWTLSPKWSPDGKSLIVCDGGEGIYKLDIQNSDISKLLNSSAIDCDWSPDGDSVVYVTTDGLNLLDINKGIAIRLLEIKDVVSVAWK